jgi:uncharacterized protein (TIGR03435 family)
MGWDWIGLIPRKRTLRLEMQRKIAMLGLVSLVTSLTGWAQATAQGNKLEFDVASVRENKSGEPAYSNFPLGPGPQFDAKGGLLVAKDMLLLQYIVFAYKPDMFQIQEFRAKLPEWARTTRFDIEARADGSPTKDAMRLMTQSLLEERFHMVVHRETREEPAYAVVLAKPGVLGPRLKPHPAGDPDCSKTSFAKTAAGAYPVACGASASIVPETPGDFAAAGYKVTMEAIAPALGGAANLTDRRVLDRTGLTGTYDFRLEFAPESPLSAQPDASADLGPGGPSFTEAMKNQLGLKLVPQKLPLEVIVIDHIERPTEN